MPRLTDPVAQAEMNLLAHAWIIIWGKDNAELHVGITNMIGFRIEIDAAKLYVGHKFQDHEKLLDEMLDIIGIKRQQQV